MQVSDMGEAKPRLEVGEAVHVKQDGVDYGWFKVVKVTREKIDLLPLPGKP